jgi:2-polyprenyl-3-methyl-5-hydroxy-6-metoxy-1,4-benzoquinol methylase
MNFYSELSDFYDVIFPLDKDTVNFLKNDLKPNAKILDLACVTGDYSIALAKMGFIVNGIDLNGGMIKKAKEKAKGLDVNFMEYDMTKVREIFKDEKYDLIFCIGNSLVHLGSMGEIREFISNIYEMLSDNGIIVIQIINFDRIFKYNIKSLPVIEKPEEGIEFYRKYDYENRNVLNFKTEIIHKNGEVQNKYKNTVTLVPILLRELRFNKICRI